MNCKYHYIDPTGNITVLVESDVPIEKQIAVANEICREETLCEQVGYISLDAGDADIRLRMAGGEFCGNATMSAAVVYVDKLNAERLNAERCSKDRIAVGPIQEDVTSEGLKSEGLTSEGLKSEGLKSEELTSDGSMPNDCLTQTESSIKVKASGAEDIITVSVEMLEKDYYAATVEMPIPIGIEIVSLTFEGVKYELPLVRFDGICHAICLQRADEVKQSEAMSICSPRIDRDIAERAIRKWCVDLGAEGLGLMLLDEKKHTLHPLVYVKAVDTMFWEHSCASGTTAVGYYLSKKHDSPINIELQEPGGILAIKSDEKGHLYLSGHVRLGSEKTMNMIFL